MIAYSAIPFPTVLYGPMITVRRG